MGDQWRMPTNAEFLELINNCTSVWTTFNGVAGRLFTSNTNGRTLFLPAAGAYNGTVLQYEGLYGRYWGASYVSAQEASDLYLASSTVDPSSSNGRRLGFSIRAVRSS